jgi:hypothetical protein
MPSAAALDDLAGANACGEGVGQDRRMGHDPDLQSLGDLDRRAGISRGIHLDNSSCVFDALSSHRTTFQEMFHVEPCCSRLLACVSRSIAHERSRSRDGSQDAQPSAARRGGRGESHPLAGDRRASMDSKDHLGAYDESSDRIVFSSLFKGLSREEKIITLMHELLHTTLIAKNEGARNGYYRDRRGGMIYARHEAWLDNLAIALAKRLRLIPQDYPETSWRRYYKR